MCDWCNGQIETGDNVVNVRFGMCADSESQSVIINAGVMLVHETCYRKKSGPVVRVQLGNWTLAVRDGVAVCFHCGVPLRPHVMMRGGDLDGIFCSMDCYMEELKEAKQQ